MRVFIIYSIALLFNLCVQAQQSIYNAGNIKYECKINNHKNLWFADEPEEELNDWEKQYRESMPVFSTYYYNMQFSNNKTLFNYIGRDENVKKTWDDDRKEDDVWYHDFNTSSYTFKKNVFGEVFKLQDSIKNIQWHIVPNDTRVFANFTCRKAYGVIFDSVYVFAYYTDAITCTGGPMSIQGLPGMIMALTIPRMHLSCVATSFNAEVKETEIMAPKKGAVKSTSIIYNKVAEATKDWGRRWAHKGIWKSFL
jgi:GLPGLI family protein